ncbi:MAG TPA: hypothetical protein VFS43_13390 [Polyangiaceae bacterium]|nr:hypothetical protein [Polyangiaceae bacterium]
MEAPLPPASYSAVWGALESAAGALAAEVLAALRQGDVTRARVATRSLAAVVEACSGAGAGQGVALEAPAPALTAAASADPPGASAPSSTPVEGRHTPG